MPASTTIAEIDFRVAEVRRAIGERSPRLHDLGRELTVVLGEPMRPCGLLLEELIVTHAELCQLHKEWVNLVALRGATCRAGRGVASFSREEER
jgi:hypothetical protein